MINPVSSANIRRLFAQDPNKALHEDEWLKKLKKAETDPQFAKEMKDARDPLSHDYSQYFQGTVSVAEPNGQ